MVLPPMPPNPNMMQPMPGAPMPMDPSMMGMAPMMPQGIPGFPPGVIPDMNYPGSPAVEDASLMLAMQDPDVAMAIIRLMLEQIDPDPGPKYPPWYRKENYPKPKIADVTNKARSDRTAHSKLIERMRRDRDRIIMAVGGTFDNFDPEVESRFFDASLALDVQLITSILSACDYIITKTARKAGQAQEAQDIENFCYALSEQSQRRHHHLYGTNYKADQVKIAMSTGHLVTRVTPNYDVDEAEIPILVDVLDPASCFITRDAYGVETVTRIYHQSIREVCHGFGLDKKQQKKLLSKEKEVDGEVRDRTITDTVEVIEYWNRRYFALVVDSDGVIGPVEHHFGRPPFVVTRSAIGDAGPIFENNLNAGIGLTSLAVQNDLANKGQSHIQLLQKTHEQREALMGVVMTEIDKIRNPPRTFEQGMMRYGQSPAISNAPGSISMLSMGEEKEIPNTPDSRFQLMGPILSNVNEAAQMGRMSPADYGLTPGSQSSGAVIEGLSESSKDKLNLWKTMIQDHEAGVHELSLIMMRDHGRKLGPEGSRGNPLLVEKQHPTEREDGFFDFDYRMLRDDTCRVQVQMTSLRLQNLGSLGNAVQMWTNMGRMTDEEALELRGVRDPLGYMRKVEIESFKKTPEFKTARLISWMKQEGMEEELPTVLYLLATKGGTGGQQQAAGPGPLPGNGGPPPTVGMPGAAGQEGGRPVMAGPTPSMTGLG
jgi:hypothetical protein